jgi:hypothetical protein
MWGHCPALSHVEPRLAHLAHRCLWVKGDVGFWTALPTPVPPSSLPTPGALGRFPQIELRQNQKEGAQPTSQGTKAV